MVRLSTQNAVCTLFEGHYHYGVAVLVNSLHRQGYRGEVYAGYRGAMPLWSTAALDNSGKLGKGGASLNVSDDIVIHFIPLKTNHHLTNCKPDFMADIWKGPGCRASRLYYFDPDIVVCAPWSFFEEWVEYGVALCEDVNSPLPENHPRRAAWRRYYGKLGIDLSFKTSAYVNGGFVGLSRHDVTFLDLWKTIQEQMAPAIGGLQRAALPGTPANERIDGPYFPFGKTDQDALNATVEAWTGKLSIVGQEAMSIKPGAALIPHALGHPKPWRWNPWWQAISGRPPRRADQEYWRNAIGVIMPHSTAFVGAMRVSMKIASAIGRFYRRR